MKAWKWDFRECRFVNEGFGMKGIRNEVVTDVFCCKTGDWSRRLSFDTAQHSKAEGK